MNTWWMSGWENGIWVEEFCWWKFWTIIKINDLELSPACSPTQSKNRVCQNDNWSERLRWNTREGQRNCLSSLGSIGMIYQYEKEGVRVDRYSATTTLRRRDLPKIGYAINFLESDNKGVREITETLGPHQNPCWFWVRVHISRRSKRPRH